MISETSSGLALPCVSDERFADEETEQLGVLLELFDLLLHRWIIDDFATRGGDQRRDR
jgi:hypothetical protein